MSSNQNVTTNFRDSNGVDLGSKLVRKDYLISVYPGIGQQIGIPPELWTWGSGTYARLGTNDVLQRSTPVTTFAGGTDWKQVSSGYRHTAAIKTDGTLWTWGKGGEGQLGNAQVTNISTPVTTFSGGNNWKQVSAGRDYTAAIKTDGTLWTWGTGGSGRLGNGAATGNISTPVTTFTGGNNWKQVATEGFHAAAIKTDGTLWTWGSGAFGRLGNANVTNVSTPITTFTGGNNWKQVSVGDNNTAAIKTDGTLWTWGNGLNGRLGNASTTNVSTPVTTFAGGNNWKQSAVEGFRMAAIKTDGTLWTWGIGGTGRLGTNDTITRFTPVTTFAGGNNWKQVSIGSGSGTGHTAAVKTDGTLWTWGSGDNGRLGTNDLTNRSTPVTTFAGGTNWKQASAGSISTAAIKSVDF